MVVETVCNSDARSTVATNVRSCCTFFTQQDVGYTKNWDFSMLQVESDWTCIGVDFIVQNGPNQKTEDHRPKATCCPPFHLGLILHHDKRQIWRKTQGRLSAAL